MDSCENSGNDIENSNIKLIIAQKRIEEALVALQGLVQILG